jgi:hypothetical protein
MLYSTRQFVVKRKMHGFVKYLSQFALGPLYIGFIPSTGWSKGRQASVRALKENISCITLQIRVWPAFVTAKTRSGRGLQLTRSIAIARLERTVEATLAKILALQEPFNKLYSTYWREKRSPREASSPPGLGCHRVRAAAVWEIVYAWKSPQRNAGL